MEERACESGNCRLERCSLVERGDTVNIPESRTENNPCRVGNECGQGDTNEECEGGYDRHGKVPVSIQGRISYKRGSPKALAQLGSVGKAE